MKIANIDQPPLTERANMLAFAEEFTKRHTNSEGEIIEVDYPWLRLDGEPDYWYARFTTYLRLGAHRSINNTYRVEKRLSVKDKVIPGGEWHKAAFDYNWKGRAEAYDRHQGELLAEIELQEKLNARALRRAILSASGTKFEEGLEYLPPIKDWKEAAEFLRAWTQSVRDEYNDNSPLKVETTATVTYKVIQELTTVMVGAFLEVNAIEDPEQRREAYATKIKELQEYVA